jgi:hypothetical protein
MIVAGMNRQERRAWARKIEKQHRDCDCKLRKLVAQEDFPTCPNGHTLDLLETPFFIMSDGRPVSWNLTGASIGEVIESTTGCEDCDEEVLVLVRVETV